MDAAVNSASEGPSALPPEPVLPLGPALKRFALEVLIAGALFALLSMLGGLAWSIWRGVELALQGVSTSDANAITRAVGMPGPLATIALSLFGVGGTALVTMLWRAPPGAAEWQRSRASLRTPATWWLALFTGAAVIFCNMIVTRIASVLDEPIDPTNMVLVRGTLDQYPWALLIFAVVVAPIYEEILFRRVLFRRLWLDGWPMLGAVLSGLLFAFMHEPPFVGDKSVAVQLPLWLVYTGMGVAFAWVYRRTGSLAASILAHGINNAFAIGTMMAFGINS